MMSCGVWCLEIYGQIFPCRPWVCVPVASLAGDEAAATPASTEQQAEQQAWTRCVWRLRAGEGGFGLPLEWAFDPGQ
ncbi:uncharacterized protein CCOS01_12049 [Colletotrichum costaricense]|uniref:Uncharacterized protein n=1 Tax=Colletotrichum costaricense TaxID=1209916 RepID=A0AAJ0DWA8_9PEZI|nr:uncharacterized protein CCOS01_12049 [Colletotrichum costaricense]KAK1517792.1 hypothetical protein CCOS01_12049 [Colletotrichum costaricense]